MAWRHLNWIKRSYKSKKSAEMLERQVEGETQETAAEVGKMARTDDSTMAGTDSAVVTEDRNNREQSMEEVTLKG